MIDLVLPRSASRELLENNLLDAEIHLSDKRREMQAAERLVRQQRARLEYFNFREAVERTYGSTVLAEVDSYTIPRQQSTSDAV